MNPFDILKKTIINKLHETDALYQEVDGFWVFDPNSGQGCYAAHHLRIIADYLDELNEPWQRQINEYFGDKQ